MIEKIGFLFPFRGVVLNMAESKVTIETNIHKYDKTRTNNEILHLEGHDYHLLTSTQFLHSMTTFLLFSFSYVVVLLQVVDLLFNKTGHIYYHYV